MRDQEDFQAQINLTTSPPETFDVSDTNLIIRSSDHVDFRVHKSVLAMASPFFRDLLSLPQPSDAEIVDGLPVVQLPEGSELLNALISILYPIGVAIPNSYEKVLYLFESQWKLEQLTHYDKVLYLLAACQKYEMASVQSLIRAEVSRGTFPGPKGAEAFGAYVIASAKGLIPEMENAARQTLEHPMTFETLGEGLRFFEGWALCDLVDLRRRCADNLVICLDSFKFLEVESPGPSSIWFGCPENAQYYYDNSGQQRQSPILPNWLSQFLSLSQNNLDLQKFTEPLDLQSRIRGEYLKALRAHLNCHFCLKVHTEKGSTFCAELESKLAQAGDKVAYSLHPSSTTRFTFHRHVQIVGFPGVSQSSRNQRSKPAIVLIEVVIISR